MYWGLPSFEEDPIHSPLNTTFCLDFFSPFVFLALDESNKKTLEIREISRCPAAKRFANLGPLSPRMREWSWSRVEQNNTSPVSRQDPCGWEVILLGNILEQGYKWKVQQFFFISRMFFPDLMVSTLIMNAIYLWMVSNMLQVVMRIQKLCAWYEPTKNATKSSGCKGAILFRLLQLESVQAQNAVKDKANLYIYCVYKNYIYIFFQ